MADDTSLTGAWPINASTPVGLFRFQVGDVVGTPHADDPTKAEFEFMGDATIEALIAANPDSIATAKAQALQSMATQLIVAAQDIQVDDIKIKTIERANMMLQLAADFGLAGVTAEGASGFQIVPMSTNSRGYWPAQGTPYPELI